MKFQVKTLSALGVIGLVAAGCAPTTSENPGTENVGEVAQANSNIVPTWPANGSWLPIQKLGTPIVDPLADTQGGSGNERDLVGDANNPTSYIQSDANNVFFRIRLGATPIKSGTSLQPFGWGCEVLTDANPKTYEFLAEVDGIANTEYMGFYKNTDQTGKSLDDPADKPDDPALQQYAPVADNVYGKAHVRVVAAGTSIGGNPNFFIDMAVDRTHWEAAGITPTTKFAVVCGSSSSAQGLAADILATTSSKLLSEIQSDKMVCSAMGCQIDPDTDKDGIPDSEEGMGDTDGDGVADYKDLDSDNDGIPDAIETNVDTDGDGKKDYLDLDSDGDMLSDAKESGHGLADVNGKIAGPFGANGLADAVETSVDSGAIKYTIKKTDPNQPKPDFQYVAPPGDTDGDGLLDSVEKQPDPNNPPDTDGDGTPDFQDLDSDGDGIPDAIETDVDTDGDGVPDYRDLDSDNDGIPDAIETAGDTDGDGTPDFRDLDADDDGAFDAAESGHGLPNMDGKIAGPFGANGLADAVETSPDSGEINYTIQKTDPGQPLPDFQTKVDADGDGIGDPEEIGPDPNNPLDTDGDGIPDVQDLDSDNDGIPDAIETNVDTDGDGTKDFRDLDADDDGLLDAVEAGHGIANTDGKIAGPYGANGLADAVETSPDSGEINYTVKKTDPNQPKPDFQSPLDSDGDGVSDKDEIGPDPNKPRDTDGDGTPDYLDDDADGDGILDKDEAGDNDPSSKPVDTDGDGTPDYLDLDSDDDGIPDAIEAGDDDKTTPPVDTDGDGTPDFEDIDSDGDGISDKDEAGADPTKPVDTDGDGTPNYLDTDSDGDGIPDAIESGDSDLETPAIDTDGDGTPDYLDLDSDNDCASDSKEAGADPMIPADSNMDGTADYVDATVPNTDADANCGDGQTCDMGTGTCVSASNLSLEGGGLSCATSPSGTSDGLLPIAGLALAGAMIRRRRMKRAS